MDNFTFPIEMFGILLALLGFSGADKHVERGLAATRRFIHDWTPLFWMMAVFANPSWENLKMQWPHALKSTLVPLLLAVPFSLIDPGIQERFAFYYSLGEPWSLWKVVALVLIAPFFLTIAWSIVGSVISALLYIGFSILWSVFWLLSRPPSGVLGTLGLLVALAPPALRYLSA